MLLSRLRVRQKLALLVLPLLVLIVVGAVPMVGARFAAASGSTRTADTIQRAVRIGELVQELQQERLLSLGYVALGLNRDRLVARSARVLDLSEQLAVDYGGRDDALSSVLRGVGYRAGLGGLRDQVLRREIGGLAVWTAYTDAIQSLIDLLALNSDADLSTPVGRQELALDAIIRHDESTSAAASALFVAPAFEVTPQVVALVNGALSSEDREERIFRPLADPETVGLYGQVEDGPSRRSVGVYLDRIAESPADALRTVVPQNLLPKVESLTGLGRLVETRIAAQAVRSATGSAQGDRLIAGFGVGLALVVLLAAIILSVLISRSIARPLRRLTESADAVAEAAQAELVRVADTEDAQAAAPRLHPVRVGTSDELGELAEAFNRVQRVAADLVERQAVSRRNVATMFGNVGRRTQNLVGRQLAMIDSLERNEQDPVLLERLYRLDHVSTRLRRNANSLVVLSGAADQELSGEPLSVADTIRAALGEIEGFQRVRLVDAEPALLTPHITPDVILLLAELLENSTSFSPPHTEVEVGAGVLATGAVRVRIVDHGLGMTPEQLAGENARLVERERLDLAPTDVLGLFVVGRLSRRHGIRVTLLPTPGTGLTAEVVIPARQVIHADGFPVPVGAPAPPAAPGSSGSPVGPGRQAGPEVHGGPGGPGSLAGLMVPAADAPRGLWVPAAPFSHGPAGPEGPGGPAGAGREVPEGARDWWEPAAPVVPVPQPGQAAQPAPTARQVQPAPLHEAAQPAPTVQAGPTGEAAQPAPTVQAGPTREPAGPGIVRRVRGAQHPRTDPRPPVDPAATPPPPVPDEARQAIEDFESGVRRALEEESSDQPRRTGHGGDGDVTPLFLAPEPPEETRAAVEDFEDGLRRALARLDAVAPPPARRNGHAPTLFTNPHRQATSPPPAPIPPEGPAGAAASLPTSPDAPAGPNGPIAFIGSEASDVPAAQDGPADPPAPPRPGDPPPPDAAVPSEETAPPGGADAGGSPGGAPATGDPGAGGWAGEGDGVELPAAWTRADIPRATGPGGRTDEGMSALPRKRRADPAPPPDQAIAFLQPTPPPRDDAPPPALPRQRRSSEAADVPPPRRATRPSPPDAGAAPGSPVEPSAEPDPAPPGPPAGELPDDRRGAPADSGVTPGRPEAERPRRRAARVERGRRGTSGEAADPPVRLAPAPTPEQPPAEEPPADQDDASSPGLARRVPGAQMPVGARAARPEPPPHEPLDADAPDDSAAIKAEAARAMVELFEAGVDRALHTGNEQGRTTEESAR